MPSNRTVPAVMYIVLILVLAIIAYLIPALFVAQESPETLINSYTLNEDTVLSYEIISTVTNIDNQQGSGAINSINLTVSNLKTGETADFTTVENGETVTANFEGGDIEITPQEVISDDTVIIEFSYPLYIGWPIGAKTIVQSFQLFIGAIILLLFYYMIIDRDGETA